MVLKNTNSPFNTGATQKLCNRGAYKDEMFAEEKKISLTITLEGLPRLFDPLNPSTEHVKALHNIYKHFGFDGPTLEDFYNSTLSPRWSTSKSIELSSNTSDFWDLPEKIDRLLKDDSFLEEEQEEDGVADVNVHKVVRVANTGKLHAQHFKLYSKNKLMQPINTINVKKAKGKQSLRGVQRRQLLRKVNQPNEDHDTLNQTPSKLVTIKLEMCDHFDARTLHSSEKYRYRGYGYKLKTKSLCKAKGCVNGRYSVFMHGYDKHQIQLEKNRFYFDESAAYDHSDFPEDEYEFEIEEENSQSYCENNAINLYEYLNIPLEKQKSAKNLCRNKNNKSKKKQRKASSEIVNVNSASSQTTIKHEKGSFEIIDNPFAAGLDSSQSNATDDDFVFVDKDHLGVNGANDDEIKRDEFVNISCNKPDINTSNDLVSKNFSSPDKFVIIRLVFSSELSHLTTQKAMCLNEYNLYVKEYPIFFANSFPFMFTLRLCEKKISSTTVTEWSIVCVSQSSVAGDDDYQWSVSLRCAEESMEIEKKKELFLSQFKHKESGTISLENLVEITLLLISGNVKEDFVNCDNSNNNDINSNDDDTKYKSYNYNYKNNTRCNNRSSNNNTSNNFSNNNNMIKSNNNTNNPRFNTNKNFNSKEDNKTVLRITSLNWPSSDDNVVGVFSMEEIIKRLSHSENGTYFEFQVSEVNGQGSFQNVDINNTRTECDICFNAYEKNGAVKNGRLVLLPCNHSYCYECWQSHVFFHCKSGSSVIKCMHTDCQQTLNDVVLNALIPNKIMNRLRLQQRERMIDTSLRCKWCPQRKCDKIAFIKDSKNSTDSIEQFGCPVVCECESSWCFACQRKPHYPASCSQTAAYFKLLAKLNYTFPQSLIHSVSLKPCPGCKYPIEKNEGCPHMQCSMCFMSFCWKCLRSTQNHVVWKCTADENSNFSLYNLKNDVISDFPLKYLINAIEFRKKYNAVKKYKFCKWLNATVKKSRIHALTSSHRKPKHSFHLSFTDQNKDTLMDKAIATTYECVDFLLECFYFLEYFYVLLSFAELSQAKGKAKHISLGRLSKRLDFISSRIEYAILSKDINKLIKSVKSNQLFLNCGRDILSILTRQAGRLQKMSLDVPEEPFGELDPTKYIRYS